MAKLYNLARMTTATTGTGIITLGSSVSGYLSFSGTGVADGDVIAYGISDGSNSEVGTGVYTASGTTLTRSVTKSTNSNAAISLSGTAQVFITARAEDIVPDEARQNALLSLAYQSKMYGLAGIGGYRRAVNVVADGFTTTTGINSGSSSNYQMDNISGILGPLLNLPGSNLSTSGNAIAGPAAAGVGTVAGTADGSTTGTNGWGSGESGAGVSGVSYVGQNFGTPRHIRQLILNQGFNGDTTYCCTSAIVQFSDDGSTWTNHSTITLSVTLSAQTFALAASGLHQYWRIRANSAPGAANRWGVMELQMMEYTVPSNMVAITTAQTADASVSNCRALIEFDNTGSPTLGTDLTIELTCNGGTNWTSAGSYTVVTSNSQGSRKVIETNDVACTAGASFAARIKTFNNKNIPIYAITLTVH